MPCTLRCELEEAFQNTFNQTITRAIGSKEYCTAPARTHVSPQAYGMLLQKMHLFGILSWRSESFRLTLLSHQVDTLCMTEFTISKDI